MLVSRDQVDRGGSRLVKRSRTDGARLTVWPQIEGVVEVDDEALSSELPELLGQAGLGKCGPLKKHEVCVMALELHQRSLGAARELVRDGKASVSDAVVAAPVAILLGALDSVGTKASEKLLHPEARAGVSTRL
ncbi:MAG: hypothetical protein IPH72_28950 [Sandaracinaceae bacterium]|nr:hypothetical protein [Sandaracinaceae bacterium]